MSTEKQKSKVQNYVYRVLGVRFRTRSVEYLEQGSSMQTKSSINQFLGSIHLYLHVHIVSHLLDFGPPVPPLPPLHPLGRNSSTYTNIDEPPIELSWPFHSIYPLQPLILSNPTTVNPVQTISYFWLKKFNPDFHFETQWNSIAMEPCAHYSDLLIHLYFLLHITLYKNIKI